MNKIKELYNKAIDKIKTLYRKYRNWGLVFVAGTLFGAFIFGPMVLAP